MLCHLAIAADSLGGPGAARSLERRGPRRRRRSGVYAGAPRP